jgi:hypothetical protein
MNANQGCVIHVVDAHLKNVDLPTYSGLLRVLHAIITTANASSFRAVGLLKIYEIIGTEMDKIGIMDEKQMTMLLTAIATALLSQDSKRAMDLTTTGMTLINGAEQERVEAWQQIEKLAGWTGDSPKDSI